MDKREITVLDLFSGAGGLSEGFFRNNFKFVSHVEMDKYAAKTLLTRVSYYALKNNGKLEKYYEYLKGYISLEELLEFTKNYSPYLFLEVINKEITKDTEKEIVKKIKKNMSCSKIKKVDVIIGGPPCQAYSVAGRSRDPDKMRTDSRNYLYKHYVSFLKIFKPNIFVFENVPGLLTALDGVVLENMIDEFDKIGYTIDYKVLNAADFNVLQNRKRIILIGWHSGFKMKYPKFEKKEHVFKVIDLLDDLPPLQPGQGQDGPQEYTKEPSDYLKTTKIRNKNDVLIQHFARTHNERDRAIYRIAIDKWRNSKERVKYSNLPPELKTHKNQESFKDRFKVIAEDETYSHTVVAHISKDGHYYIHPDKEQARSLTVREVARIQSFPDDFKFEGPRIHQYRQIGNAVPPLMAEEIAREIKEMLVSKK